MTDRRNVWITGASRGLGAALVHRYIAEGAHVYMTARDHAAMSEVAMRSGSPERCHALPADVTDAAQLKQVIQAIIDEAGHIDLAILNAGTYVRGGIDDFTVETMREIFEINVFAIAAAIEQLLPGWRAKGRGQCAIVGSVAGDVGLPYAAFYSASKSALRRMAESLFPEFERAGLGLHLISPGFVDTPLTSKNDFPMPFMVSAERAAEEIYAGLEKNKFEIRFPARMSIVIRLLAALPYALKFALCKRMLR